MIFVGKNGIDGYVDSNDVAQSMNRPRAPLKPQSKRVTDETAKGKVKQKSSRNPRTKKSESITVLWNSLQHFSKNNLGRTLGSHDNVS
jgi:hypothetical protein